MSISPAALPSLLASTSSSSGATPAKEPTKEQLQNRLKASLQNVLSSLDKPQSDATPARKAAARRDVAELKQRLDSMKNMLTFLSPQAAKALMAVMKQMAQQLRAAAEVLKGSAPPTLSINVNVPGVGGAEASAPSEAGQEDAPELNVDSMQAQFAELERQAAAQPDGSTQLPGSGHEAQDAESRSDSALLQDVSRRLKQAVAMLKSALPKHDKESQKLLKSAEEDLKVTAELASDNSSPSVDASAVSGSLVNVTA